MVLGGVSSLGFVGRAIAEREVRLLGVFLTESFDKRTSLVDASICQCMRLVVSFQRHHFSCQSGHYSLTYGLVSDDGNEW